MLFANVFSTWDDIYSALCDPATATKSVPLHTFLTNEENLAVLSCPWNPFPVPSPQEKQKFNTNSKEYTVAGLVTEYTVRDGFKSGEKVAFMTLEDYTGSYGFRLGDRDYLRLRDKLDLQRFVILKIKFSISKDGRVFVNVTDVIELKEAFEKYCPSWRCVLKNVPLIAMQWRIIWAQPARSAYSGATAFSSLS